MFQLDNVIRWLFFMVNPFLSMLLAFREYFLPYAKNIFWAFCVYYGFTFAIAEEASTSDINRYVIELSILYKQHSLSINQMINIFLNSGEIDVLKSILSFSISRFTDNRAILTLVYATIFGYFYSRNIWYIFTRLKGKLNLIEKILILTIALVIPIWFINGFRMWTAFHIFMYGLLPYIFENKKDKLIFIYLSWLVHFSYLLPIGLFIAYQTIGNRTNLFFIIFLISVFVSNINIQGVNNLIDSYAPTRLEERSSAYTNEDVIAKRIESKFNSKARWYVKWKVKFLDSILILLVVFLFFSRRKIITSDIIFKRFFSLVLIFYSFSNYFKNIPSGGRYLNFSFFLTLAFILLYINTYKNDLRMNFLVKLSVPSLLLFSIVSIRMGFYNTSLMTIMGNPLFALFNIGETHALNDFIK